MIFYIFDLYILVKILFTLTIIMVILVAPLMAYAQSLVNSTGGTIQNNNFTIEYSIGEIGNTTLEASDNFITQGLLQPFYLFKDCKLLEFIPNAFTPNNDNLNDCFGVKNWPVTTSYQFSIYNRWGVLVFNSNKTSDCWNGDVNGVKQQTGTYVYVIKANSAACGQVSFKGTFVLIR
jgi:gliding motility-associated-like protein